MNDRKVKKDNRNKERNRKGFYVHGRIQAKQNSDNCVILIRKERFKDSEDGPNIIILRLYICNNRNKRRNCKKQLEIMNAKAKKAKLSKMIDGLNYSYRYEERKDRNMMTVTVKKA